MNYIEERKKKYIKETDRMGRCYISRVLGYYVDDDGKKEPNLSAVVLVYQSKGGGKIWEDWQETADKILECLNS